MSLAERIRRAGEVHRRLGPYTRREGGSLAAASVFTVLLVAVDLARPWPIKVVIDQVILGKQWSVLPPSLQGSDAATRLLWVCAAAVLVLATGSGALAYLRSTFLARAGHNAVQKLRKDVYAKLLALSLNYHDRNPRGDLLMRLTGDVNAMKVLLVEGIFFLAQEFLVITGVIVVMLALDAELTAIALVTVPSVAFVVLRTGIKLKQAAAKQRRKEGEIATSAKEALDAVPVIQAYGLEESSVEQLRRRNKKSRKAGLLAARLEASMSRSTEIAIAAGTAVMLVLGARRVLEGAMTAGELIVLLSYVRTLYKPLRRISTRSAKLFKSAASGERILEILDEDIDLATTPAPRPMERWTGDIRLEVVSYGYGDGHPVLDEIDLNIEAGEHVALVGPNGAGKSTLVSLLHRLRDPRSGRVLVSGVDVRELDLARLRQQVAVVFQNSLLFDGSVLDNIALACPEASEEQWLRAARDAGVVDFCEGLPQGLQTRVGEGGQSLSGGQRQRIALARALVRNPSILVLDEPTASIDDLTARRLRREIPDLFADKTIVCVTHDPDWIHTMDRVIALEKGRIVADQSADTWAETWSETGTDTGGTLPAAPPPLRGSGA